MENEKMPNDGAHPWGLHVPDRAPTPSEGVAYQYARVGPDRTQRVKTFENGTCIEFGPYDAVDEFLPHHPFFDQVLFVDRAIKDCSIVRQRHEGVRLLQANAGDQVEQDPFDNFRSLPLAETYKYTIGRTAIGGHIYTQVPSKFAHCASLVSHYSVPNKTEWPGKANTGPSSDTRWGLSSKAAFEELPMRGTDPPGRGRLTHAYQLKHDSSRGDHGGGRGGRTCSERIPRGGFWNGHASLNPRGGHGHQRFHSTTGNFQAGEDNASGYGNMALVPYGNTSTGIGGNMTGLHSNAVGHHPAQSLDYETNTVASQDRTPTNGYEAFTVDPNGRTSNPTYRTPLLSNTPLDQAAGAETHPHPKSSIFRGTYSQGRVGRSVRLLDDDLQESENEEDHSQHLYGQIPESVHFGGQATIERVEETSQRELSANAPSIALPQQSAGSQSHFYPNPEAAPYQSTERGRKFALSSGSILSWNSAILPNGQYYQLPIPQPGQGLGLHQKVNGGDDMNHSTQSFASIDNAMGSRQSFYQDGEVEGLRLDVPRSSSAEYSQHGGLQGGSHSSSSRPPSAQHMHLKTGYPLRSHTASTGSVPPKMQPPSQHPRVRGTGAQPHDGQGHRVPLPDPFATQLPRHVPPVVVTAATPEKPIKRPDRSKAIHGLRKYQPSPNHPNGTHKLIAPNGMIFSPREILNPIGKQNLLNILKADSLRSSNNPNNPYNPNNPKNRPGATPSYVGDLQSLEPGHQQYFHGSQSTTSLGGQETQSQYDSTLHQMSHSAQPSHVRGDSYSSDMSVQTQIMPLTTRSLRPAKVTRTTSGSLMSPRKEFVAGPAAKTVSFVDQPSNAGVWMGQNNSDQPQRPKHTALLDRLMAPQNLDEELQARLAAIESRIQAKDQDLDKLLGHLAAKTKPKIDLKVKAAASQPKAGLPAGAASSSKESTGSSMKEGSDSTSGHQQYLARRQEEIVTQNAELKKKAIEYKSDKVVIPMLKPPGADSQMARNFSPLTIGPLRGKGNVFGLDPPSRPKTPMNLANGPPARETSPIEDSEVSPVVKKTRRRLFEL